MVRTKEPLSFVVETGRQECVEGALKGRVSERPEVVWFCDVKHVAE